MSQKREWKTIKEYQDILFEFYNGIAKITINRPRYRNAFTPTTTSEISDALYYCRECQDINVIVLSQDLKQNLTIVSDAANFAGNMPTTALIGRRLLILAARGMMCYI